MGYYLWHYVMRSGIYGRFGTLECGREFQSVEHRCCFYQAVSAALQFQVSSFGLASRKSHDQGQFTTGVSMERAMNPPRLFIKAIDCVC